MLLQLPSGGKNFIDIVHLLLNDNTATELEQRLKDDSDV